VVDNDRVDEMDAGPDSIGMLPLPTWTVGCRTPSGLRRLLEWRDDERRWVGFELRGPADRWVRFYQGPCLEVEP
jgi:hypothetical protein